jgi:type I restriction enzyme S subunit
VIQYIRGITFKPEEKIGVSDPDAIVCMRTKNVQEYIDESDLIAVPSTLVRREELLLREGDILLSSANSWNLVGKVCLVPRLGYRATAGGFIAVIRPRSVVESRFLYRWLSSDLVQERIRGCARQTTNISNLSVPQFEQLRILLPPLPEQRRIADILDKADSIRRKRKEAIALTEELLRSAFLEMFGDPVTNPKGWPVRKLGDVAALYAGNSLPSGSAFVGQSDGYLLLKVGDMNMSGNESEITAAREWISRLPSSAVAAPAGCVVIPKRGGAIATNKKRVLQRAAALDPNLMAIEPLEGLRLEYLREWFSMIDLGSLSNGSSVPQLNKKDLIPLVVAQPPLAVQDRFVQFSRLVRRRSESLSASAIAGELLFNSLVARAFTGTLESS